MPWMLMMSFFFIVGACDAEAWWNEGWQYRKKISINTTVNGADIKENLMDVPILIRLHTGNFDFDGALPEGGDIRFISSDDTRLLKHHIEQYDIIDEIALIWVKLPRLSGQTDQEFIWIYYGNKEAMGGQDAKGTYDAAQAAVFHMNEIEGTPQDTSPYGQAVTFFAGGLGLPSVIGRGVVFNGGGDRLVITHSSSLKFTNGFTFSSWVRISQPQEDAYLFRALSEDGELIVGIDGTKIYSRLGITDEKIYQTEKNTDLAMDQWHHVMITSASNQRLILYLDGLKMFYVNIEGSLPDFSSDYVVGSAGDGSHGYFGDLDEIQLSSTVRSADWARTAFASQGPDGLLYSFGMEELGGGGGVLPVFYLGTIFKNITLDGWLVISSLIILMIVSWLVFLRKAFFLWNAEKENQAFGASFKEMNNPVEEYDPENGDDFENSSLYGVYAIGCRKVREESEKGRANDSEGMMKVFKTALEEGYINEGKRLNAYLVVLTMAVTGGPFLGLLGTVWGVMNTFAAMAEAGEANIMAIAPGVASALSTTVFGLIVAIPALFSYNYLVSRIKSITADLAVFIDQLTLKVERHQGDTI